MIDPAIEQVLKLFKLNEKQRTAVLERGRDVVVTAGAGSGKTTTLVAWYACLLAEGVPPRRMAAMTFTRKAAREMRSRVRQSLVELQQAATTDEERQKWVDFSAQMDSARIGTIHSLCAEILLAHPAEAGVDPRFQVLDENLAAALRIQAVDDSLKGLVEQAKFLPLLERISTNDLEEMLQDLLNRRLEADDLFKNTVDNRARYTRQLKERMNGPRLKDLIKDLRSISERDLPVDTGDTLPDAVKKLLQLWAAAETALAENDPTACTVNLYQARYFSVNKSPGKKDEIVKKIIAELQETLDSVINQPGWEKVLETQPSLENETLSERLLPLLREAFDIVCQSYIELVQSQQALDFDDLEYGAQILLGREEIREHWQTELDAVLVDEFQDTNQRQRKIVEALAGERGVLFIVGDMRQSIYRFRRADVTVFKEVQDKVRSKGGLLVDLDKTYRAHESLLLATGDLLSSVIGTQEDPKCSYYIPYTPMVADKKNPPQGIKPPHVEFVFGVGEDAETGRALAARALAERLLQLKDEEQIKTWDEVALLFRAATGFPPYEEALEEMGIPFVTVAGRGFYDRPEIRDVMNILRALSDPMDDLSFAGLLRSPAFGLSDAALFLLRQSGQPYWTALQGDLSQLSERDQDSAVRTRQILSSLLPLVDRVPVAELLKQVLDSVDYRAILATADLKTEEKDASAAGGRLWRNLDKLLEDALVSPQISVRDFLDLLKTLNDADTREGEAPAEALGSVRLMTIHKAKGLEFPVVVLADASRQVPVRSRLVYLSEDLGVTFKLDPPSMLYSLAKYVNEDQDEMERLRVLYVALTRAKAKLLVSGHATRGAKGQINVRGWTADLIRAVGIRQAEFLEKAGEPFEIQTGSNLPIRVWCLLEDLPNRAADRSVTGQARVPEVDMPPLYQPIVDESSVDKHTEEERSIEPHPWSAILQNEHIPGNVLGNMVHKAIQRWRFPGDPLLEQLLRTQAQMEGLMDERIIHQAIQEAEVLLQRFQQHPLYQEMNTALERQHEVPFLGGSYQGNVEWGFMDCLYRTQTGWTLVDIKTDELRNRQALAAAQEMYTPQILRYRRAVEKWMRKVPRTLLCFLNVENAIEVIEVK